MKVLLVDQFSELGGAQRGLIDAALGIVERGGEVHAALPEGDAFDRITCFAKAISSLTCGPFRSEQKSSRDAFRFAAQIPGQTACIARMARVVDLVYVHGPRVALAAALSKGTRPLVYHAHSIVQQKAAASILGRALGRYDRVLAVSQFVSRWLSKISSQKPSVIYNGVAAHAGKSRESSEFIRIGMLGRVAPEKGQLEFVRAARLAAQANARLRFFILGGAMFADKSYFDQVRAEAGPEVTLLPWSEEIGSYFSQLDLLVVPSSPIDAGPRVIMEAFAARVPVLASNGGGIPELIERGKTGWLVNSIEPMPLAQAMLEAARDSLQLQSIGENAYSAWQTRFTVERYQSEVCDALEDVLRKRQRPSKAGTSARA